MTNRGPCEHCGAWEDEHHAYVPIVMPPGCRCDPESWSGFGAPVPTVCPAYRCRDGMDCHDCQHGRECHTCA